MGLLRRMPFHGTEGRGSMKHRVALALSTTLLSGLLVAAPAPSSAHTASNSLWQVHVADPPGAATEWKNPRVTYDPVEGVIHYDVRHDGCGGGDAVIHFERRLLSQDGTWTAWDGLSPNGLNIGSDQYCNDDGDFIYHASDWGGCSDCGWLVGFQKVEIRFWGEYFGILYLTATSEPEPPSSPTLLSVAEVTRSTVSLSWTDNASDETSQQLQRSDDERSTWQTVASLPPDQTTYTDDGLTPGHTYWYRIRASNANGDSGWSNELEVTPGCELDTDCDGLSNSDETDLLGTDPKKPDTDGDGLLDPWEVPSSISGSGIRSSAYPDRAVSTVEAFGPSAFSDCPTPLWADDQGRLNGQYTCFNHLPDPLHKDVYLELDWQDCGVESSCPHGDPMHHAPDLDGLKLTIDAFANADVANPDGSKGVNLNILIDESLSHEPNCDQNMSSLRSTNFGTELQRTDPAVVAAKSLAVRYVWSGHSSHSDDPSACPTPRLDAIGFTSLGMRGLEDYDWSPFGDANASGRDILISLGPLWSCSAQIDPSGVGRPADADCDRDGGVGIYPTYVDDGSGNDIDLPWPVARLLGLPEPQGMSQLWGRTLMRLLGRSLGITDEAVLRNLPDEPGEDPDGDGRARILRVPDQYTSWTDLVYAPTGDGAPASEPLPRYASLVAQDLDGDDVPEGEDNCPGIFNPREPWLSDADWRQPDSDFDGLGNACDDDIDADGVSNGQAFTGELQTGTAFDPYPYDSDDDGLDNGLDLDDDGDGIPDLADNCQFASNAAQLDLDVDGSGDPCDPDDDNDGIPDLME